MGKVSCFSFAIALIFVLLHLATCHSHIEGKCLPGSRHKPKPGPEDDSYKACHVFQNSSCCTSSFTNQLAVEVIEKVETTSWTLCGKLSKRCQDFMVGVECFYSCSPYVAYWGDPNETQAFNHAPVCADYCNDWYDACKDQPSCAKNWLKDFQLAPDWSNSCKQNCTTFGQLYTGGKDLCESMWDDSFNYTTEGPCLHFKYQAGTNPNLAVVEHFFGGHSTGNAAVPTYVSASFTFASLVGLLAHLMFAI